MYLVNKCGNSYIRNVNLNPEDTWHLCSMAVWNKCDACVVQ